MAIALALPAWSACVETDDELSARQLDAIGGVPLNPAAAYRVRSMRVVRHELFDVTDPETDGRLYRWANRLHTKTREDTVRQIVVFEEGDIVTAQTLEESERLLRRKSYVYDARVVAARVCDDPDPTVDVVAVVRDVWAWVPNLGLTRTGGDERFEIGVSDINLAGSGAFVAFDYFDNLDRDGVSVGYRDPNLGASRIGLGVAFEHTSDGERRSIDLGQPFYALTATSAWNVGYDRSSRLNSLWDLSAETASFRRIREAATVSRGWSKGLTGGYANRWSVGYTWDDNTFPAGAGSPDGLTDRTFSFPWLAYERIENAFEESRNEQGILGIEDIFLGWQSWIRAGLSTAALGDSRGTHVVYDASMQNGFRVGSAHLTRYGASINGVWSTDGSSENVVARAWIRHRLRQTERTSLIARLSATRLTQGTPDAQVLLGGDSGLRGYPNRYQSGDRRVVATIEQRYFTQLHILGVLRVAAAGFIDIGRAWTKNGPDGDGREVLWNLGVGLRLQSTKTQRDLIYHIDLAVPMRDGPGVEGVELSLTSRRGL